MAKGDVARMSAHRQAQAVEAERHMKDERAEPKGSLSQSECDTLAGCELVIERGLTTFVEVGEAIATIREGKLYRETHSTWDAYSRERWGMSPQHAGRLITGAKTARALAATEPRGSLPTSEKQVRPLSNVAPEKRAEVWAEATQEAGGQPTAKQVEDAVQRHSGTAPTPPEVPDEPEDEEGYSAADFVAELERATQELSEAQAVIKSLQSSDLAKELTDWIRKYGQLEGRLRQSMQTEAEARRLAGAVQKRLGEIRKMLRVDTDAEVIACLRDLLR